MPKTTKVEKSTTIDEVEVNEIVTKYIKIPELPKHVRPLAPITESEKAELEIALQFNTNNDDSEKDSSEDEDGWHEDWSGNLALLGRQISNPLIRRRKPHKTELILSLLEWAEQRSTHTIAKRLGRNLLAYVHSSAPPMAQKILSYTSKMWEQDERYDVSQSIKRCSYDPTVLREDGWTTKASKDGSAEQRASGGPAHIGQHIYWQGYEAVVIAYVHDNDIGDLWKAVWLDGFETFDLEAEELQTAVLKWNRRKKRSNKSEKKSEKKVPDITSNRFAATKDFHVDGIEHGVVLATTYNPNARQGVFWPARVMHASELDSSSTQRKRSSAKQKVNVVFLAPYWNSDTNVVTAGGMAGPRGVDYSSLPLFQMESIEVSESNIQKYPYGSGGGLNRHQLQIAFRFTGLPKNAFRRFIQSHQLAMALKTYAKDEVRTRPLNLKEAKAALFDTHALALNAPRFPSILLHLPFDFILSKIQTHSPESATIGDDNNIDPAINLAHIMKSMEPPHCYGGNHSMETKNGMTDTLKTTKDNRSLSIVDSPVCKALASKIDTSKRTDEPAGDVLQLESILSKSIKEELERLSSTDLTSSSLFDNLKRLVARCNRVIGSIILMQEDKELKIRKLRSLLQECLREKVSSSCLFV